MLALGERRLLVALQQLREAEDGVERRAQLVAHRGQELALGRARGLGEGARGASSSSCCTSSVTSQIVVDRAALGGPALDRAAGCDRRGAGARGRPIGARW